MTVFMSDLPDAYTLVMTVFMSGLTGCIYTSYDSFYEWVNRMHIH